MPLTLSMQINIIIYSVLAGIMTGFLFDIYRGIRGLNSIKVLIVIQDLLFWILSAMIIFTFLLYFNYAFLTPYVYMFIFLSILFYLKFISKCFYFYERKIAKILARFIRIIFKNICYPLRIVAYKITDKKK